MDNVFCSVCGTEFNRSKRDCPHCSSGEFDPVCERCTTLPVTMLFNAGQWWAEVEDKGGNPTSASGGTKKEAMVNLRKETHATLMKEALKALEEWQYLRFAE